MSPEASTGAAQGREAGSVETVLAEFELTRSLSLQWTVVGTLGFIVGIGVFGALLTTFTGAAPQLTVRLVDAGWWNAALDVLVFAVLATAVVPVHEYVHGFAITYYGGTTSYGVGLAHFVLPYAYATTDHRFDRGEFVVVALAPLVVLSVLGTGLMLALGWGWLVVPLAANAAGAVGDVWMTLTVLGYPEHVRVEDSATGVRVLGRPDDDPLPHSVTAVAWDAVVGGAAAVVVVLLTLGVVGPFALSALGVESLTLGRPGSVTFLFEYVETPDSLSYSVGPGVVFVGVGLGLLYAFVESRRRQLRRA